jgi:hypothetical protein
MGWETGLAVIIVQVMSIGQVRVPLLCRRSHRTWANNVGCRCATAIVQTAQRSWARIGESYDGFITLGLERGCFDGCKELNPG